MSINGYALPEAWLHWLVACHVLCAIIGIGPTYFIHVLLRKGQTLGQLREGFGLIRILEKFPKTLGPLAVLSGLLLAWLGGYGFRQFWIYGSIVLYVLIQVIVIGFLTPLSKKVAEQAFSSRESPDRPLPPEIAAGIAYMNRLLYAAGALGTLLFIFMFFKPTL